MEQIENKPLTYFEKIKIKVVQNNHLDLTKSNHPDIQGLVNELLQGISKLKGSESFIISSSTNNEPASVMTTIIAKRNKSNALIFSEPNPVTIYYNSAVKHNTNAEILQKQIINKHWSPQELYPIFIDFFSEAFQGITQLIMSLEALFNQQLSEDITVECEGKSFTKKELEWKDLKTKYKDLLPIISSLNISESHNNDYQNILKLNDLRNDLIHLKSIRKENFTYYQELFKKLIDFDFKIHSDSVHKVIELLYPE